MQHTVSEQLTDQIIVFKWYSYYKSNLHPWLVQYVVQMVLSTEDDSHTAVCKMYIL